VNPINTPAVPWITTGNVVLGMLVIVMLIGGALWAWNQAKKAFGRKPPLHEEFDDRTKGLRSEIYHAKNSALKEMNGRFEPLEKRVVRLEDNYEDMQADRVRKWEALQREISGVQNDLAFIRGKFERRPNDTSAGN
jgi:hypothetical protein